MKTVRRSAHRLLAPALFAGAMLAGMLTASPAMAQSDWSRQAARIISSKQTYPTTAQMRGEEGTARVKVYVSADGSVQRTELAAGSGSPLLDREALAMPTRAGRLPAPPGGATILTVPVTWKLI